MPLTIIYVFYLDGQTNIAPGEQIIYVDSWGANRTDEEIKAAQVQREQDRQAVAAERQRQFKNLEKKFGL